MSAPVPKTKLDEAAELIDRGSEVELHRARRILLDELRRDPANPFTHNLLGEAFGALRLYEESLKHARAAVRLRPDDVFLLYNLGSAHKHIGHYAEAAQIFQLVAESPDETPPNVKLVLAKRMARINKLACEIGAARRTAQSGPEIVDEIRR